MKNLLICLVLILMLSACGNDHVIRFNFDQQQQEETEPSYEGRSHFFFWGMWQKTDYNLENACQGRGIKAIEVHWTWFDSLIGSLLTMGIYAPESFSIYCN